MSLLLLICCAAYIAGIISASLAGLYFLTLFSVCTLLIIFIRKRKPGQREWLTAAALIMLVVGGARYMRASENTLYNAFPEKYVCIEGSVRSLPRLSQSSDYKYRYEVKTDSVIYLGKTYAANGKILLNTDEMLGFGEGIRACGFLRDFSGASNEFGVDFRRVYESRGIFTHLTALELTKTGIPRAFSPRLFAGRLRFRMYENMRSSLSDDDFALACAVLFGDRSGFDRDGKALIQKTGVSRVLYSSFTHISVMLLLISFLTAKKNRREVYFVIAIALYLIFGNVGASALKAFAVIGLIICERRLRGHADTLGILAFTVFLMTFDNPLLCFDGGFMISVISTLIIFFSYDPIHDRLIRSHLLIRLHAAAYLTVMIILTFGVLPFSAYYFDGVSPYAVLLMPLLLPFIAALTVTSPVLFIGKGLYAALVPVRLIYRAALAVLKLAPYAAEKLPFYYITLPKPPILALICFCILWWIFLRALESKLRAPETSLAASALAGLLACSLLGFNPSVLSIYFVNVGQGDAAILHTFPFETVLIDGGGSAEGNNYNIGDSVFLPYLTSHGFTRIDTAVVSHYHKDHVEGIISAAKNLRINTLILPDCMPDNKYRRELEDIARKRGIKTEYLGAGDSVRFRSGLTLTVIAPDAGAPDTENENNTSLVIKVRYGDLTALFTGDFEAEEKLSPPYSADILKVSHHGAENGNSDRFLEAVAPRIAVISVGAENSYGLPDETVVKKLHAVGATVLRTDMSGDIRIKADKKGNIEYNSLFGGDGYAAKRR